MSIILSRDIVLTDASVEDPNACHIGYRTLIARSNITADYAEQFYPIENVVTPATNLFWRSISLNEQYITIAAGLNSGVDYVGFANHNFGSAGIAYQAEASDDGETWEPISDEIIPDSDAPHVQVFPLAAHAFYRIRLTPTGTVYPRIAVLYLGKMLVMQRRTYVGHTPITMGRETTISNNRSETGQFLGRVVRREFLQTSFSFKDITPEWYRSYFDDFAEASRTTPFFIAWRPLDYPLEVGYCWATDDIVPKNQRNNGMMSFGFKVQGIGKFVATATAAEVDIETDTGSST